MRPRQDLRNFLYSISIYPSWNVDSWTLKLYFHKISKPYAPKYFRIRSFLFRKIYSFLLIFVWKCDTIWFQQFFTFKFSHFQVKPDHHHIPSSLPHFPTKLEYRTVSADEDDEEDSAVKLCGVGERAKSREEFSKYILKWNQQENRT